MKEFPRMLFYILPMAGISGAGAAQKYFAYFYLAPGEKYFAGIVRIKKYFSGNFL